MQSVKRLYRSRKNSVLTGVAGGIGEYLNLDPTIVRILFVLLALVGASGLIIYIILALVVPLEPLDFHDVPSETFQSGSQGAGEEYNSSKYKPSTSELSPREWTQPQPKTISNGNLIAGLFLIILGIMFLMDQFIPGVDFSDLWPILLIFAGIYILLKSRRKN